MCVPYLIEIKPTRRAKPDCIRPVPNKAGLTPPAKCSPPPCIITIEPRSPKPSKRECSSEKGSIQVRGEASPRGLALQFERRQEPGAQEQSPCKQVPSPQPAPPNPPICNCLKKKKRSSSRSSSPSTSVSTRSFDELKEKVEQLIRQAAGLEKELQADRSRANQNVWVAAGRDDKVEREVSGLKAEVGGLGKEVELLRRDLALRAERKDAEARCESRDNEGR
ncbi:MAG: hypothetical protein Q9225_007932, partial [Loekoesia sp. 1 TL-2023]